MKILIVTAWYHPFIHPRAHRWTVLAEYWAQQGHSVQVLTARAGAVKGETRRNGVVVHRLGFDSLKEWAYYLLGITKGRGRPGVAPKPMGAMMCGLEWLYKAIWKRVYFPDDACVWYCPARRKLFQLLENDSFDALITVSLPFTDHLLGLKVKRRFPDLFWLADIGDPFSFQAKAPNNSWLYSRKNLRLEKQVLWSANAVTVTTEATKEKYSRHFGAAILEKVSVIPPVFKPCLHTPSPGLATGQSLTLGYFGALYVATRTPDVLLYFLAQIQRLRPAFTKRLSVHFWGEIFPEFYAQLSGNPQLHLHGLQSREAAWAAMKSVDILLNIGNTTDFQLPSKAVEYLAVGKPILNISYVAGDPFKAFFEDNDLVFNLLVKDGGFTDHQALECIEWLESEKQLPDAENLELKISPFLVANIAAQYEGLINGATPQ